MGSGNRLSAQEVSDDCKPGARAIDTICAEKSALTDLAQQLAALPPEDRRALTKLLAGE